MQERHAAHVRRPRLHARRHTTRQTHRGARRAGPVSLLDLLWHVAHSSDPSVMTRWRDGNGSTGRGCSPSSARRRSATATVSSLRRLGRGSEMIGRSSAQRSSKREPFRSYRKSRKVRVYRQPTPSTRPRRLRALIALLEHDDPTPARPSGSGEVGLDPGTRRFPRRTRHLLQSDRSANIVAELTKSTGVTAELEYGDGPRTDPRRPTFAPSTLPWLRLSPSGRDMVGPTTATVRCASSCSEGAPSHLA